VESRPVNAPDAPAASGGYSQAVEVVGARRLLFISGQIPVGAGGEVPTAFGQQCHQAWANVEAQLRAARMTLDNLIKVTTYLSDRRHASENRDIRQKVLGARSPALTVVVTDLFDEAWRIEIEGLAAD
jgi:enamine deaminase RidA (YjgF/YER057c/UK114 family)